MPRFGDDFSDVAVGEEIDLPSGVVGTVEAVLVDEDGITRFSGSTLPDGRFVVALNAEGSVTGGFVEVDGAEMVTNFTLSDSNTTIVTQVAQGDFRCSGIPLAPRIGQLARKIAPPEPKPGVNPLSVVVPTFDSVPSAAGVIFLDFDGQVVRDPSWYGGKTIEAAPATIDGDEITEAQILRICQAVAEDFSPVNVSVTTSATRYARAPIGKRIRCIVTPTKEWLGKSAATTGGVAYMGSFARLYPTYQSSTIPVWCFDQLSEINMAMTISHEVGHAFNLKHDGDAKSAYYAGHGNWGPLMGAPFNMTITQWSKGEYAGANNKQDDIAILTGTANKVGRRADDVGSTPATARKLATSTGTLSQTGLLSLAGDLDYFEIKANAGTLNLAATSIWTTNWQQNTDFTIALYDGPTVLAVASPSSTSATLRFSLPKAGTYHIVMQPSSYGDPKTTGYSTYGALGHYRLTGTFPKPLN